ncbi:MAG: Asp-tRNA(Asn)/Glu-tRNA(Gln) amidotransferase subunit GatC [Candidatus Saccharibacteria bacterium]|uniref:Aspartyl/glutamyl-tRNA(Asn/Gln) amidotransferase subunit C n=1 Tax=Candidatus Nanosyncoccus alces TaxID=2171997 RepID=A0ABY0FLK0_9BACT|nr:Asp-tRNA(Asn)/Glu-tRNA(Gln) amidotransferase subunit GatC [Candidatus Nanosyncoccus alces]MBQ2643608.1 Asp-tRNA(Asn)/Glu-tRNA(Gln) amidotransferase subunit GatC [Candidatus Saccharibacteria bacterium]MDO4398864.1 Asp-tRNA(Asn)/Glu-tRNA(Gln) amidotransferase subunit GatC [Candidatus Saccharibacteria bacterium]RYC74540.1 Aspartyl/glutamyl-tRNA(Asn/Gln) amidotransferase subunit C [Candidatus Nanosyncoccus alces]
MDINREDIKHLADLSDFALPESEIDVLGRNLQDIIGYISQLEELDTDNIEPTYQVFEMENVWREDEIKSQDASREQLLALTKEEKDHQIKVPKVL